MLPTKQGVEEESFQIYVLFCGRRYEPLYERDVGSEPCRKGSVGIADSV